MPDINQYLSLAEYAALHGKEPSSVRHGVSRGMFSTARKIGRNWVISADEPYPDNRVKTGKYVGWRNNHKGEQHAAKQQSKKKGP